MKEISNEYTLRIRDKNLLDRLQEMFNASKYTSYNSFLNALIRQVVFKELKEDEILEKLEIIDDKVTVIKERMK